MVRRMKFLEEHESEESKDGAELLKAMKLMDESENMDPADIMGMDDGGLDNHNAEMDVGVEQVEKGKKIVADAREGG
jgi:hypothetical protein